MRQGWLLGAWFDPASPVGSRVVEPERLLPALVRAARYEQLQLHAGPWHAAIFDDLAAALPRFRHYWEAGLQSPEPVMAARGVVPVKLDVPEAGVLEFRLAAEPFARDPRFRLMTFFPADLAAMHWCEAVTRAEE
jgi:hypothetical protein